MCRQDQESNKLVAPWTHKLVNDESDKLRVNSNYFVSKFLGKQARPDLSFHCSGLRRETNVRTFGGKFDGRDNPPNWLQEETEDAVAIDVCSAREYILPPVFCF